VTAYSGSDALDSSERKHAEGLVERFASQCVGEAGGHALRGSPADVLLMVADEVGADLIVVGNLGMKGMHRVLGSVPNTVAHKASCAVLIVNTA
jgi:nucleotide-binding universal stress UspA family protein